ncbi:hypothetical protein [Phyllobacterium zundukense]|uniref:Uncharacterized protein n=1 Tax=Phyllobacterium zundukense TaxID=1867719 RepID=A0A2N9W342_9HYPH|nr:hypothetical protein [Phyllobacterium zundukense]ATU94318.1 hypothetical protein BLM14_21455 [Phyllobacterium zundukense]PIO46160.1 hypothetical protein B5P45_03960 [Phyllobacterium zundukense]
MRSLIFKTALAAILISTPLATAYAASHDSHDSHGSRASGEFDSHDHDRRDYRALYDLDDDPVVNEVTPMPTFVSDTRLNTILGELHAADGRIMADRGRRMLNPAEVRGLRSKEAMIRGEAVRTAALNGGVVPGMRYHVIQRQIANLDTTISRDARHV